MADDQDDQWQEIEQLRLKLKQKQNQLDEELNTNKQLMKQLEQIKTELNSKDIQQHEIDQVRALTDALMKNTRLINTINDSNETLDQAENAIEKLKIYCQIAKQKIADLNREMEKLDNNENKINGEQQ